MHAGGFCRQSPHNVIELSLLTKGTLSIELEVAPHRGERRPKFVGGISDELAQAGIGGISFVEHDIEGKPEFAGLGTGV